MRGIVVRTPGLALVLLFACGKAATPDVPDMGTDMGVAPDMGPAPDGGVLDERFLTTLETPADLAAVSGDAPGVKYLANLKDRTPEPPLTEACYFQNMRLFPFHLQFLLSFDAFAGLDLDTYVSLVIKAESRVYWGGTILPYPNVVHPATNELGVVTYTVYSERDELSAEDIVEVQDILHECMPFAQSLMIFVPEGIEQKRFVQRERARLQDMGVWALFREELISGLSHQTYSAGESYGTLRINPKGQPLTDYGPKDIVITQSAPNDISVVQGLITESAQNELSHVNLRLTEKGLPNVAVPRIYEAAYARALDGHLVHLEVTESNFVLEAARLEDAEAFWAQQRPQIPEVTADLSVTALGVYGQIGADSAQAYGAKAANLAELHQILPAENRVDGFAIPFSAYRDFMEANGLGPQVEALLNDPLIKTNADHKRAQLKALRKAIERGELEAAFMQSLQESLLSVFGASAMTARIRFRSSTNVEDLDVLTGAGLYSSKSGCLADDLDGDTDGPSRCVSPEERAAKEAELAARRAELMEHPQRLYLLDIIDDLVGDLTEERPVARAVKKVWASLWNERAFDERDYYGVDHRLAYMGIAVNPSFVLERASAVAITELNVDDGAPLYRLNSQIGSESVVRPDDPTAIAESLTFRREANAVSEVRVLVESSLLDPGATVWSTEKLEQVGALLFLVHDHFGAQVYPDLAPVSIDVELKHTMDGRVVLKQARPFISITP